MAAMAAMGMLAEVSTREARSLSMSMPDTGGMQAFALPVDSVEKVPAGGPFAQKLGDGFCRHVTFDDVSIDLHRMA